MVSFSSTHLSPIGKVWDGYLLEMTLKVVVVVGKDYILPIVPSCNSLGTGIFQSNSKYFVILTLARVQQEWKPPKP